MLAVQANELERGKNAAREGKKRQAIKSVMWTMLNAWIFHPSRMRFWIRKICSYAMAVDRSGCWLHWKLDSRKGEQKKTEHRWYFWRVLSCFVLTSNCIVGGQPKKRLVSFLSLSLNSLISAHHQVNCKQFVVYLVSCFSHQATTTSSGNASIDSCYRCTAAILCDSLFYPWILIHAVNNILKDKRSSAEWVSECVWYCAFVWMYDSESQFVQCSLTFPLCRIGAGNICLGCAFDRDVLCHAVFVTCFRLALGTANSSRLIVFDLWIKVRDFLPSWAIRLTRIIAILKSIFDNIGSRFVYFAIFRPIFRNLSSNAS